MPYVNIKVTQGGVTAGQEATKIARQILMKNRVAHEVLKIKQKDLCRELHSTAVKKVNQYAGKTG
jgi:phenylpyruvate tautomerase PptA (4-oxalocrotonate tautomerase family)